MFGVTRPRLSQAAECTDGVTARKEEHGPEETVERNMRLLWSGDRLRQRGKAPRRLLKAQVSYGGRRTMER